MLELLTDPQAWIALLTLTALELVLGIDNIIFISILASRLPEAQQAKARNVGLGLAMLTRIGLLLTLSWLIGLTKPLITIFQHGFSGRDLILLTGGLFLVWKSTHEIHERIEGDPEAGSKARGQITLGAVLVQIALLDLVFSLDSVITAVGMVDQIPVMVAAVVLSVGMMLFFAGPLNRFVMRHPTIKMLALSFLLLIGFTLCAEGLGHHIPKGYIYFAMAFSVMVEMFNLKATKAAQPVQLNQPTMPATAH